MEAAHEPKSVHARGNFSAAQPGRDAEARAKAWGIPAVRITRDLVYATYEAKFPAAVDDVKAAVGWLRSQAAEQGIDPRAIGAIGGSAGAHLVAMLATTAAGTPNRYGFHRRGSGGTAGDGRCRVTSEARDQPFRAAAAAP